MNKEQENLYNNLTFKYNFNEGQKDLIKKGIISGVDVTIYSRPEYNENQMQQILLGLKDNLDVSCYLNPNMNWEEMKKYREYMLEVKMKTPIKILFNNYLYG